MSFEILTNSHHRLVRQDTKIRYPEPMLKDCTPPAALTLVLSTVNKSTIRHDKASKAVGILETKTTILTIASVS